MQLIKALTIVIISIFSLVEAQSINNIEAIQTAIKGKEEFSFFYAGHSYGHHNSQKYWQEHTIDYPALSLLKNIELLNKFDFAVFGGDIVQRCNQANIEALQESLLQPIGLPTLNSTGNHDRCLSSLYNYDNQIEVTLQHSVFYVISSAERDLEQDHLEWLEAKLTEVLEDQTIQNIFVFTHRPIFLLASSDLQEAGQLANMPVNLEYKNEFMALFGAIFSNMEKQNKHFYWFAGDVGVKYPLIYHSYSSNVHMIASGLYETAYDNIISVTVSATKVEVAVLGLEEVEFGVADQYDYNWLSQFWQKKNNSYNYQSNNFKGQFESIKRLHQEFEALLMNFEIQEGKELQVTHNKNTLAPEEKYTIYLKDNHLLYLKESCDPESEGKFFLHFYPIDANSLKDQEHPFNNHDGSVKFIANVQDVCLFVSELPLYELDHLVTGQYIPQVGRIWSINIEGSDL